MTQEVAMTTMAHPAARFADVRHHPVTTAALVTLFWIAAAVLVATCHTELDARSPSGSAVATIAAIGVVAYAYTRLCALGVGIAWLVLTIVTEIAISTRLGHGWFSLIGTPDRPLLRNVLLFVWVFA